MIRGFIHSLDYPAGIAHRHTVGRNVAGDHTSGTHYAPCSDGHARQNDRSSANPCPVLNTDGLGIERPAIAALKRCGVSIRFVVHILGGVSGGVYLHVRSYKHMRADVDAVVVNERAVHVDNHVIAHMYVFPVLTVEVNIYAQVATCRAEYLAQDVIPPLSIAIIEPVQLRQQPLRA